MFRYIMHKLKEHYKLFKIALFTKKQKDLNPWDYRSWEKVTTEDGRVVCRINLSRLSPFLQRALWKRLSDCKIIANLSHASHATEYVNKGEKTLCVVGCRNVSLLFSNILRKAAPITAQENAIEQALIQKKKAAEQKKQPPKSNKLHFEEISSIQDLVYRKMVMKLITFPDGHIEWVEDTHHHIDGNDNWLEYSGRRFVRINNQDNYGNWVKYPDDYGKRNARWLSLMNMDEQEQKYLKKALAGIGIAWDIRPMEGASGPNAIQGVYVNPFQAPRLQQLFIRMKHEIGQTNGVLEQLDTARSPYKKQVRKSQGVTDITPKKKKKDLTFFKPSMERVA